MSAAPSSTAGAPGPRGAPLWGWIALLTAGAAGARLLGLASQPLIDDDRLVADTAANFAASGWPEPTMWNHPRLRDLLVHASAQLWGGGPLALKGWSVLLGTLSVPAAAWLVLAAGGDPVAALAAGLLLAVDPLHLDFSRQAINDVYLAALGPAAVAALWRHRSTGRARWLAAAGALLGLGLASKWAAAFPVAVAAAPLLWDLRHRTGGGSRPSRAALAVAALVLLPAAVYLATFLPWFTRGGGLGDWVRLQLEMARETSTHTGYAGTKLPGYFGEQIGAWRWFLTPTWYADYAVVPGSSEVPGILLIVGIANPAAWLLLWPALAWALRRWWRGDAPAGRLAAAFLGAYLPFLLVRRPIWANSAPTVLPFAAAVIGVAFAAARRRWRRVADGWLALAALGGALLCFPAAGLRLGPSEAIVEAIVPPEGLVPAELRRPPEQAEHR